MSAHSDDDQFSGPGSPTGVEEEGELSDIVKEEKK